MTSQIDALEAVLSSIPEELYHEVELEVHDSEGAATNRQRLEVLKEQQELIDEENAQNAGNAKAPKDIENIDEDEKTPAQAKEGAEKEAEASSGDTSMSEGSSERAEQDRRALGQETEKTPEPPKKE